MASPNALMSDSPDYREMYDAADPSGIPRTARMVAAYVDEAYAWADRAHRMFPNATVVTIAVSAADDADVLDVEPGCATIWQVRGWLKRQYRRGYYKPTVYCSKASRLAIRALTLRMRKDWWIAAWTGRPYTLPYAAVVQYASTPRYDVSLVKEPGWPFRDRPDRPVRPPLPEPPKPPAPAPAPAGPTPEWDDTMKISTGKHAETAVALPNGARGIRISASPKASLLVEFGSGPAHRVEVAFATGAVDIPLPREGKSLARQVRIIRADDDIDASASVVPL